MTSYLITGATGTLGHMIMTSIMSTSEYIEGKLKLIAIARDVTKLERLYKECSNVEICAMDICSNENMNSIIDDVDYIIHCAATTTSATMISNPVEVADGIVLGTKNILELARRKNVKSMVYLSSMEVYGSAPDIGRTRKECELGEVDLDLPRSCYPLAKRMAEHYCHIYAKEYDVSVKIARLAQTFGQGVQPEDKRVYMQFARAVCENKDIVLNTLGDSMGNYCSTDDAVKGIFTILKNGSDGEVYNVVNESNTMTIKEMAELVAEKISGGKIKVRIEEKDLSVTGYAPSTGLRLSSEKLRNLGWTPTKDLIQMYEDVIEQLR